jgi:outer membrane autotransporter protein
MIRTQLRLTLVLGALMRGQGCGNLRGFGRRVGSAMGIAFAVSLFAASGAQAQNCQLSGAAQLSVIGTSPASVTSMIAGAITSASTAFLLQSTAFIGSPPNPAPGQQGGGIWVRGVGGNVDIKSTTTTNASATAPASQSALINCSQTVDTDFTGIQFGADTAKLNINGWNIHFGTTAGYLGTKSRLLGGGFSFTDPATNSQAGGGPFNSSTQVPFIGVYAAATNGGFSVDALLRTEYYQTTLNAPLAFLNSQSLDAQGLTFASSAAYQWNVPNTNWFIEPSAGIIISRIKVDPFNYVTTGTPGITTFAETLKVGDIKSEIGRLGLRFGTSIAAGNVTWQPFAAVSVWHEFGHNVTANAATCPGQTPADSCAFFTSGGVTSPVTLLATSSTSTFGTYGQYSLGASAALAGTGWVGFARVDFRDGPNLHGWDGTGGVRYQFSPEAPKAILPVKTKAPPPVVEAVNWTGFYIGAFGGATQGRADWGFAPGAEASPHVGGYLFGGDIGYNYQFGAYVLGVEGDISKTNTNGGTACNALVSGTGSNAPGSPLFQMTCSAWAHWIATATARVGYTWDRALFYVKGGGAWTDEHFSATCNLGPLQPVNPVGQQCVNPAQVLSNGLAASTNRGGWVFGFGTEFALTRNWSAKAEADYVSFGDTNVTASDGSPLRLGMHFWEEKIGVNYRF